MTDRCCRAGIMFGREAGVVSVFPNSTIDVEPVEYAVNLIKWADIFPKLVKRDCKTQKMKIIHMSYL